jgi:chromosome segregation ATPase
VAKDKVIEKINEMLGKLDVQQKEIEIAFNDVTKRTDAMEEQMYTAKANIKNLERKRDEFQNSEDTLRKELEQLKPLLAEAAASESKSIEKNGKVQSLDVLKTLTDARVKKFNRNKELMAANQTILDTWTKNYNILKKNTDVSKKQLDQLATRIEEIENKKIALDAMVKSASIAAPGVSLSDEFDKLTANVDDLLVKVDAKLEMEGDKIDDRIAEMSDLADESLSEILGDKTDIGETMDDLDKILGNDKK